MVRKMVSPTADYPPLRTCSSLLALARGKRSDKPTDVNIHSADSEPPLMETHQNLGSSIDLSCCAEIDVAIVNTDTRTGKISLGLIITDLSLLRQPSVDLGEKPISSNLDDQIFPNRLPFEETIRFCIPSNQSSPNSVRLKSLFIPRRSENSQESRHAELHSGYSIEKQRI
jgi:hypothetical protein